MTEGLTTTPERRGSDLPWSDPRWRPASQTSDAGWESSGSFAKSLESLPWERTLSQPHPDQQPQQQTEEPLIVKILTTM